MPPNDPDRDPVYLEWLAAAPKGVRWDRAQEMWEEYQRKRKEQADAVAKRLLGKRVCYGCKGRFRVEFCTICNGTGEL
jgi:hypothetical protein